MPTKPATEGNGRKPGGRDRGPAALALASGKTIRDAAADAKVSERSVRNWLGDPLFIARVRELRNGMYTAAVGKLADLSGRAADTLGELLRNGTAQLKLQASRAVLEFGPKLREHAELAARLGELEKAVNGDDRDAVSEANGDPGAGATGPESKSAGDPRGSPT
jgi:hypothetical protein